MRTSVLKKQWIEPFLSLFYPNLCLGCGKNLPFDMDDVVCIHCKVNLPYTNFHLDPYNELIQRFWGRIDLQSAVSIFHFVKGSKVQRLIHALKYNGKKEVGRTLGKSYGIKLKNEVYYSQFDLIVPVPLHPKKEKKRGYNQSAEFARGLSQGLEVPVDESLIERVLFTKTQTEKSRLKRYENVQYAFQIKKPDLIQNKHILLVDDVITTGATLEACALQLLAYPDTNVSIATIACAQH